MPYENYLRLFGDPSSFSKGMECITADRQLRRGIKNGTLLLEEIGNAKAVVMNKYTRKWYIASGGWGNDDLYTIMLGAAAGDIAGQLYEHHNIKYKPELNRIIPHNSRFTDDTVMTCAVANGIRIGLSQLPDDWMNAPEHEKVLSEAIVTSMQGFGRAYPRAGYGRRFINWLGEADPQPYNSWGNGSAMRVSYCGWVARTLEEAERLAEISASVTHNHPDGIAGAKAVAGSIFILKMAQDEEPFQFKPKVKDYVSKYYDLNFTLDEIRDNYSFHVSCAKSVPQAIVAFLTGKNFSDVIAEAISIGGDSDTIAAIAGSLAEVVYPIPQGVKGRVIDRLEPMLLNAIAESVDYIYNKSREKNF